MDDHRFFAPWIEDPDPPDDTTQAEWLLFVEALALMFPELVQLDD